MTPGEVPEPPISTYQKFSTQVASGTDTERTAFFSDAVFAIAMTLLASEIRVPSVPDNTIAGALVEQLPAYLAFGLSFVVVGAYWVSHHRLFKLLARYDRNVHRLNLLVLMFVALIGFATGMLVEYGNTFTGTVLYATLFSAIGLTQAALLLYTRRMGLLRAEVDRDLFSYLIIHGLVVPAVFLTSILVAFANVAAAKYLWIAIIVVDFGLFLAFRRRPAPQEVTASAS